MAKMTFDKWLADWKQEDPDAHLSTADMLDTIYTYERKHGMTTADMNRRRLDGTLPDHVDFDDWRITAEWLRLIE